MTDLRHRVERLEHAATSSTQSGATANDLANFPGMMNLVAGSGVSLTPGAGTLTVAATGGGGTVTSVGVSGNNGIGVSGSPVTTSGTITLSLGAITPTSVSTGNLTSSGTVSMPSQSITRANLVNGAGLSVIGRTAVSSGTVSDIVSTGARTFLASSSANTAVTFRSIETADLPTGDWIGANNGTAYASSFVALNADSTWFDTGASVSLSAGTYLVTYFLHASVAITAGAGTITGRLYNVTAAAPVTDSEVMIVTTNVAGNARNTGTISLVVTVGGTSTLRGEAQRAVGGTYTGSATRTRSDATGRSGITYVRIA